MFLRSGDADLAVCGAGESAFTPAVVNGFATMKALLGRKPGDRSEDDPGQASRPFSRDRAGFVLAEGAGAVVLATESAARRLGLEPQAELVGWATNSDGHHMAMPCRERIGEMPRRPRSQHAGSKPEAIDYYNAHGTSTVLNDRVETQVLKDVWGDRAAGCRSARSRGRWATAWVRPRPSRRRWRCGPSRADHPADDQFPARPRARPGLRARTRLGPARLDIVLDCVVRIRRHEQRPDSEEDGVMTADHRTRPPDRGSRRDRAQGRQDPAAGPDRSPNHGWSRTWRSIRSIWSAVILQFQDHFDVVIDEDAVPNLCRVADMVAYLAATTGNRSRLAVAGQGDCDSSDRSRNERGEMGGEIRRWSDGGSTSARAF